MAGKTEGKAADRDTARGREKEAMRETAKSSPAAAASSESWEAADPDEARAGGDTTGGVVSNPLEAKHLDELKMVASSSPDSPRGRAAAAEIAAMTGSTAYPSEVATDEHGEASGERRAVLPGGLEARIAAEEGLEELPVIVASHYDLPPKEEGGFARRLPAMVPFDEIKGELSEQDVERLVLAGVVRRATPSEAAQIRREKETGETRSRLAKAELASLTGGKKPAASQGTKGAKGKGGSGSKK